LLNNRIRVLKRKKVLGRLLVKRNKESSGDKELRDEFKSKIKPYFQKH
jgi:hypothetical protein